MKPRRVLLSLPIALSIAAVAVAQRSARADAGTDAAVSETGTDAGLSDGGADAGDAGRRDDDPPGCGAAAPPNGVSALGAGCC